MNLANQIDKAIKILTDQGALLEDPEAEEDRTSAILILIDVADALDPPKTRKERFEETLPEPTVVPKTCFAAPNCEHFFCDGVRARFS